MDFFDVNTVQPGSVRCDLKSLGIFSQVLIGGGLELVCGIEVGFDLGASGRVCGVGCDFWVESPSMLC